jgi:hypothetical protein
MGVAANIRDKRIPGPARVCVWTVALALLCTGPARLRAGEAIPASRQVVIVMRALAYDANLKRRAGEAINIAILHKRGNGASESMATVMAKAFGALEVTQVSGLPIVVSRIAYSGPETLKKAIAGSGIDAVYVCDGLDTDLAAIAEVCRQAHALTVAAKREFVEKGLSIGVFEIDAKCTILLNLPASRMEGVAFGPDLLRLARVIR